MSRHDGVSCDACLKSNFKGRRYKCLICFDYDLCSTCYENGATTNQHTTNHPMQCILTRHDFDIFYGGEALTADQPQSLTCPFCGKMGFTESTLQEHVTANHLDTPFEVVCPICASVPGGDPNHVTDDFAAHLTLDHPSGAPRELDITETGNRHGVRRMPHQGRGLNRGAARQNMRFGSVSSGFFSSSSRGDSMDPIAELLSQLSGVRRATAATRQQQLERLPTRRSGTGTSGISGSANNSASSAQTNHANVPNGNNTGGVLSSSINNSGTVVGTTQSGGVVSLGSNSSNVASAHHYPPSLAHSSKQQHQQGQSQFLLGRLGDMENEQENRCETRDLRATFVQELLLSTLSDLSLCTEHTGLTSGEAPSATSDAATQTTPRAPSTPTNNSVNSSSSLVPQTPPTGPPLTKTPPSSTSVPVTGAPLKGSKTQTKMVTRSSPGMQQQQLTLQQQQQSNGSNLGSGRVMTGTGTVSVPPPVGAPGRGRATGGPVSPGAGRRKPVRGVDGRTTQPPPPH